jgi:hypothetical protein
VILVDVPLSERVALLFFGDEVVIAVSEGAMEFGGAFVVGADNFDFGGGGGVLFSGLNKNNTIW